MHSTKFITFLIFIPFLASCQSWSSSINIPWAAAPEAPVAADTTRENTPETGDPETPPGFLDAEVLVEDPVGRMTAAIALYMDETSNRVVDGGEMLSVLHKGSADTVTIDLWERLRRGLELDHHLDRRSVQAELNWYKRHPAYLDRVAARAGRHLYHIVETVEERGLPLEIALLPIVESAFDPFAYSHGRAAGLWQFIPGTARYYGLEIDWWYDGRRDVPAATDAAVNYLEHLHQLMNEDWLLALAAYNAGQGNVGKAIRHTGQGKSADFWSLELLPETRVYVPRLLAISALIADPQKYGIELMSIPNEPRWKAVDIESQLDLAKAASLADISIEELYLLNPAFNQWSTRPEGPHRLLVPTGKAEAFKERLEPLSEMERIAWRRHMVRRGENLGLIARHHNTNIDAIKTANNLKGTMIRAGDSLLIPVASREDDTYSLSEKGRLERTREFLEDKHGKAPTRYTVKSGDSLWEIAQRFKVPVRRLAKWNGMAPTDILKPDTDLALFLESVPQSAPDETEVIRKVHYRVRSGESLSLIASKFNLSVTSIKQWNDGLAGRKYIQPGDQLTLFVDVTAME